MTGGSGDVLGLLLARAKYANSVLRKIFDSGERALAVLLRAWTKVAAQKGRDRKCLKLKGAWDVDSLYGVCKKIALVSLAH